MRVMGWTIDSKLIVTLGDNNGDVIPEKGGWEIDVKTRKALQPSCRVAPHGLCRRSFPDEWQGGAVDYVGHSLVPTDVPPHSSKLRAAEVARGHRRPAACR